MKKPKGKIDWTIAEDDETWQVSQTAAQSEPGRKTLHQKEAALTTFIAIFLLFLIGGWLWPHHKSIGGTSNALQKSVVQEEELLTQTLELSDQSIEVDSLQRLGDRMMAQVTVKYPIEDKIYIYRETHFYERTDYKWQRIAPDLSLLGPEKTLNIANFIIFYRAKDADAVYQVAPKIEQLYATLSHDIGLPAVNAASPYTIEVATDQVQPLTNYYYLQRKMTIPSPILLSAPVEMPASTVLYQEAVYPLTRMMLTNNIYQHDTLWQSYYANWPSLVNGIALWELWEDGGPLASERSETLSWLYANGQNGQARHQLPDGYTHLCRTYRIWHITPLDIGIPLTCIDVDKQPLPVDQYPALAANWSYATSYPDKVGFLPKEGITQSITMETIVEYIVAAYGRDKLPQLIAALGQYTTPETLIPALFGVSQADFEAGWQAYLAQHYQ